MSLMAALTVKIPWDTFRGFTIFLVFCDLTFTVAVDQDFRQGGCEGFKGGMESLAARCPIMFASVSLHQLPLSLLNPLLLTTLGGSGARVPS